MAVNRKKSSAARAGQSTRKQKKPPQFVVSALRDSVTIAKETGLLDGPRTEVVRGRMPRALVEKAKAKTGAKSNTELIEFALAHVAVADEFMDWLLSRSGTIPKDIDLDF